MGRACRWAGETKKMPRPKSFYRSFFCGQASRYHKGLGINVSAYHVDPFWYSHEALGGCGEGPYAVNLTSSPYSFEAGLDSLGLPMMLFLQGFAKDNVYTAAYAFAGQQQAR